MTGTFDGTQYRKTVLSALRDRQPAEVTDLFWLAVVPRVLDDDREIAQRLKATRGFLFKERSRARQAAVAQAVLNEWPRVEATLLDRGARAALRRRLEDGSGGQASTQTTTRTLRIPAGSAVDRRRRQVSAALTELARLRDDPDLAADLFAFLGLPVTATTEMLSKRIEHVSEINRRRRPDRERALVDDLIAHARALLVDGDPDLYLAGFADETRDRAVQALVGGEPRGAQAALRDAAASGVTDAAIVARLVEVAPGSAELIALSPYGLGVWCPSCAAVAAPGALRCTACGAGLQLRCPGCGVLALADRPCCASCDHSLDAPRSALVARRHDLQAELEALTAVEAAPETEREARLRALVRRHPGWQRAARRLATLPPGPPRRVTVTLDGDEARLCWEAPLGEPPDAYLVERHGPAGARVLGRTSVLSWMDASPTDAGVHWTIRALRGQSASSPATATAARPVPSGVRDLAARPGRPVVLSWDAPSGSRPRLKRVRGDVVRQLVPARDGYVDRHVQFGATYQYTVWLEGVAESEQTISIRVERAPTMPRAVSGLIARRGDGGVVIATWTWPAGTTEVFVAWDGAPPAGAVAAAGGRKITNTRYEIDGGARLEQVPRGAHLAVFAGVRGADGLSWSDDAPAGARCVAP